MVASESRSPFAETHSHLLNRSITETDELAEFLNQAPPLTQSWNGVNTGIGRQMKNVARMISARNFTESEREVFYVEQGGFDSHFQALKPGTTVYDRLKEFDDAIKVFEAEMKAQGLWDDVVIVSSSDFGRKLVANGEGTDHAWGGHHFIVGGSVKGGQILGKYPSRLDESNEQNIYDSNGRFIPTSGWEAIWRPVAEWFGVKEEKLSEIVPGAANFPSDHMFPVSEVFETA